MAANLRPKNLIVRRKWFAIIKIKYMASETTNSSKSFKNVFVNVLSTVKCFFTYY